MYTDKVFPSIPHLPQDVIEAAALLAMDNRAALKRAGWAKVGEGAFTQAWSNHEYVIKTRRWLSGRTDDVERFAEQYYAANKHIKGALATAKRFLAPTEWLFDCIAVQEVVPVMGCDAIAHLDGYDREGVEQSVMDDMHEYLGMDDVHYMNWGIGHDGSFRIFDPMACGKAWYPEDAKRSVARVMKKIA